jgi:hypothetical protein
MKDRIYTLRNELAREERELSKIEDQIKRKQSMVDKVNEKSLKCNIKTTMLGKDAQRNEYWHFIEDTERIYIRKETTK